MWLNSPRSQQNRGNWGIYKVEALCYHEIHRLIVIALRLSRYRGKRNNNQSFLLQFLPKRMIAKEKAPIQLDRRLLFWQSRFLRVQKLV